MLFRSGGSRNGRRGTWPHIRACSSAVQVESIHDTHAHTHTHRHTHTRTHARTHAHTPPPRRTPTLQLATSPSRLFSTERAASDASNPSSCQALSLLLRWSSCVWPPLISRHRSANPRIVASGTCWSETLTFLHVVAVALFAGLSVMAVDEEAMLKLVCRRRCHSSPRG
jgi:hypothetical protein